MTLVAKKRPAAPGVDGVVTAAEVAAHFGVHRRSIFRLVDAGKFPAPFRVGRLVRWRVDVVNQWIAAAECEAAQQGK